MMGFGYFYLIQYVLTLIMNDYDTNGKVLDS